TIEEALEITPQDIVENLSGLPKIKIHCSILADKVFEQVIKKYKAKK
ncbi:MAG: iron-sulfur cluster assembly scaffold protein, partial [Candidatus Marinimicrobia bacterium]|nr:iron-sulfur cluster assembly scaffold protein [Candidatus Neomarinimicrobiota bacterium]